ncbi:MAG: hypothetical protein AB1490_05400 [Pseudomonadota bacterium]
MARLKEIDDALRVEIEKLLNAEKIWAFNAFGWVSAYDVDPEFVGHAIWQTEPPIDIDPFIFGVGQEPDAEPPPRPEEWRQLLAISGADFGGLMKAARMAIGLYLVQSQLSQEAQFPSEDFMDLHWTSSIIYLATASERLREFFVAAAFRQTQNLYAARGSAYRDQKRVWYTTPFFEAQTHFTTGGFPELLGKLLPMTTQIQALRNRRNLLIHELATAIGQREREVIKNQPTPIATDFSYNQIKEAARLAKVERERQRSLATAELRDWYDLLMRASNEVFVFEYRRRREA